MNVPTPADLNEFDNVLDEYQVEVMVYEPCLDAPWVQIYRDHPDWEIETEADEVILLTRSRPTSLGV